MCGAGRVRRRRASLRAADRGAPPAELACASPILGVNAAFRLGLSARVMGVAGNQFSKILKELCSILVLWRIGTVIYDLATES